VFRWTGMKQCVDVFINVCLFVYLVILSFSASMCLSTFVCLFIWLFFLSGETDWLKRKLVVTTLRDCGNLVIKWKYRGLCEKIMTWLCVVLWACFIHHTVAGWFLSNKVDVIIHSGLGMDYETVQIVLFYLSKCHLPTY
jgi:hypothetical protein